MFTTPPSSVFDRPAYAEPRESVIVFECNPTGSTDQLKAAFMRALRDSDPYVRQEDGQPLMRRGTEAPEDK